MAGLLATPAICNFLVSCQGSEEKKGGYQRLFLNQEQDLMVTEISELIIPATDSPGAKEARVNEFIDVMLNDCFYEHDQQSFVEGLERIEKESQKNFNLSFLKASPEQQVFLLQNEATGEDHSNQPTRFFRLIKELTLFGYFTSEAGATKALAYNPVPGKFQGCVPLKKDQKAWAL